VCSQTTSGAIAHLREHGIRAVGDVALSTSLAVGSKRQSSMAAFTSSSREASARDTSEFDFEVFKGLLLQLFTKRSLPFDLIEDEAFRSLLSYCNPVLSDSMPSRRSLRRWIASAYNEALVSVESALQRASTKINLSFNLWSSPGRHLSLLGIVAHYLDDEFKPRTVLLALPCIQESHTAANLSIQIASILRHFKIDERSFGNTITDNASENAACMDLLRDELFVDTSKRYIRCMGHVINLVAQQVLFGKDVQAFEDSLIDVTAKEVELRNWRRKGPIGRLHNLIRYICHSTSRRELFLKVQREQPEALRSERLNAKEAYELIFDNSTRWNSWYDAAERALDLRHAVDDFVDLELVDYQQAVARFNCRSSQSQAAAPKVHLLTLDRLNNNDWQIITGYLEILKRLKSAIMKLQGNVNTVSTHGTPIKGAIWQVLPVYEEILKAFEDARERHQPQSSSQLSQLLSQQPSQPQTEPANSRYCNTRTSMAQASLTTSQAAEDSAGAADRDTTLYSDVESFNDLQVLFSTNINAGWQKLEYYYNKSDVTPVHRVAVLLHPRLKWRWFGRYWSSKPSWIADARASIAELWREYKDLSVVSAPSTPAPTAL
jgi:hypothetical protein